MVSEEEKARDPRRPEREKCWNTQKKYVDPGKKKTHKSWSGEG